MAKFNVGCRVVNDYLGAGEVTKRFKRFSGYMVLFDRTPDVRYNGSKNPTLVFAGTLIPETQTEKEQDNEKLERLQQKVRDVEATYEAAVIAFGNAEDDDDYAEDIICDTAYRAWSKAKLELSNYLKEQDSE